jgi:hypothetical protein
MTMKMRVIESSLKTSITTISKRLIVIAQYPRINKFLTVVHFCKNGPIDEPITAATEIKYTPIAGDRVVLLKSEAETIGSAGTPVS